MSDPSNQNPHPPPNSTPSSVPSSKSTATDSRPTSLSLLAQAARDSDSLSWGRFVAIYGSLIEKWLLSRGVERQAVDDIRQEVMAVVIRDLRQFEHNGKPGAFRNWLRTITVHRMRQHWDKSRRNRAADIQTMADQLTDPDSSLSRLWNEEHDRYLLQRLLEIVAQRVHPRTFQAFRRVAILEEPVLKVAADLDMKPGAVRVAQSRVLRALRQEGRGLLDESLDNS